MNEVEAVNQLRTFSSGDTGFLSTKLRDAADSLGDVGIIDAGITDVNPSFGHGGGKGINAEGMGGVAGPGIGAGMPLRNSASNSRPSKSISIRKE